MELHGKNLIGDGLSAEGRPTILAYDPKEGRELAPTFYEATPAEVDAAARLAQAAFDEYRQRSPSEVANFLERIAEEMIGLGDPLLDRVVAESGLPRDRVTGERGRTVGQIRMFAALVREGSWVDARIDRADPARKPLPKPDVRRMLMPIGPVAVFGASNFPLAFSVAGGDTISALAARNPVVCKAHPAHPGTSEMVARAILAAAHSRHMPKGVFSLIHGASPEVSLQLVRHPAIRAVGFTGSLQAGRALFDAGSGRPEPIPVYAEMGSVNPVFVLPGALEERGASIAEGLKQSVTMGVGQFCTCPGLIVGVAGAPLESMAGRLRELFAAAPAGTMLYPKIRGAYEKAVDSLKNVRGLRITESGAAVDALKTEAKATLFEADAGTFFEHVELGEEVFGPSTVLVACGSREEMERVASRLEGSLTATIFGTPADLEAHRWLVSILETKAGRLIFNGYPTGVEVCAAMNHGGPYPASTDSKFTSVGTAAILRFARPVCYQNFPQEALPAELRDGNPSGIWRTVDSVWTREP